MSKKSDYAARATECRLRAERARGAAKRLLLETEAGWRRLERACFETTFGPPLAQIAPGGARRSLYAR